MNTFLPKGYESLKTEKSYWKMSQMKEGDNRLRIVIQPIAGWIDWQDKKPVRYQPEKKPAKSFNSEKPAKAFWSCYVWDYAREALFILEITQMSILKALTLLGKDENWGDFTKYDVKINKEGSGKDTRYSLTPLPHKSFGPKIEEALKRSPVRLEALYDGGDPWTDLIELIMDEGTGEVKASESINSPLETLREHLVIDDIDPSYLNAYIEDLKVKKDLPAEKVIESALMPQLLEKFKSTYAKFLVKHRVVEQMVAV
jgi:hypothetical protein